MLLAPSSKNRCLRTASRAPLKLCGRILRDPIHHRTLRNGPTMMLPDSRSAVQHRARAQTQRRQKCGEKSANRSVKTRPRVIIYLSSDFLPQVSWCRKTRPSAEWAHVGRHEAGCSGAARTRASRISRFARSPSVPENIKHFQEASAACRFPSSAAL